MIVVLDYECSGLDYYAPDFRVTSAAFAWQGGPADGKRFFTENRKTIKKYIEKSIEAGYTFVVHNLQYEYGVTLFGIPKICKKMRWIDTMRLVQVYDGGGKKAQAMAYGQRTVEEEIALLEGKEKAPSTGLSLVSCASRLLPKALQNHKDEAHNWLRDNKGVRKNYGEHLNELPRDIFKRYNLGDVEVTLALYNFCTKYFKTIDYDWTRDHKLYTHIAKRISKAKGRGILVDRPLLIGNIKILESEIQAMTDAFRLELKDEIQTFENNRLSKWLNGCKMEHARVKRKAQAVPGSKYWEKNVTFNLNSGKQKKELFIEQIGHSAQFTTKKGAELMTHKGAEKANVPMLTRDQALAQYPSFASAHMGDYGRAGKIIGKRKKRELVLRQGVNLEILSAADGHWHQDLRAAGTATGRNKGGRND